MTLNLDLLAGMRDVQIAQQVAQRAELGWFETEFTMYGCAYMKNGERYYRVSQHNEKIYEFKENGENMDILPTNIIVQTSKAAVPSGLQEYFSFDYKKKLAEYLSEKFPKEFFVLLNEIGDKASEDKAYDMMIKYQNSLIGCFNEKQIARFELLLKHIYQSKKISKAHYDAFAEWIKEERKYMEENVVYKDVNKKTFYGFAYKDPAGVVKYVVNAGCGQIYQKKYAVEQKNIFTTPVYSETYYSNYNVKTVQIQTKFTEELHNYFNEEYMQMINQFTTSNSNISMDEFNGYLKYVGEAFGENAKQTLFYYGHRWGIIK